MLRLVAIMAFCCCEIAYADRPTISTYGRLVDDTGTIQLPKNFRSKWAFLGTWSIADEDIERYSAASGHGAAGLHNVYTQHGVIDFYRQNGRFPDGAVIIKELLKTVTVPMATGTVSRGSEVEGWFVMVKDTKGRFSSNRLWGDGWGWALFSAEQPEAPVTRNYQTDCLGCHIPARKDDWIYISGYPVLQKDEQTRRASDVETQPE